MDKLERYIEANSSAGTSGDNALLSELDRATNLRVIQPKMVSGPVQGAFLTLITKMLRPRLVLEIGTFTGYSALAIAAGLEENAEIHTVEIDDELEEMALSFFERSPHGHKIRLHIGSALEVVPRLFGSNGPNVLNIVRFPDSPDASNASNSLNSSNACDNPSDSLDFSNLPDSTAKFDLIYMDGDKREYPDYYRMLMGDGNVPAMVHPGTVILTDNVLWYGKVAEPDAVKPNDRMLQGILEFNRIVGADPRVENVILPVRDGINFIRVK